MACDKKAKYEWEFCKLKGEGVCHLDGRARPEPKGSDCLYTALRSRQ